jgi:hypothetical protein
VGDVVSKPLQVATEASATVTKSISQKTVVELMRALRELSGNTPGSEVPVNYTELLYARDFPAWFVTHAENYYQWNWQRILFELRDGRFFFSQGSHASDSHAITGGCLSEAEAMRWGELFIQRLAALAAQTTLPTGESVLRSLQLDGFAVDWEKLRLVPLEGPVSAREEEDTLAHLVQESGIPDIPTVLKHVTDAHFLLSGWEIPFITECIQKPDTSPDRRDQRRDRQTRNIFNETTGSDHQSNRLPDKNQFPYSG